MKIYPYKIGSASAKALAAALGCKVGHKLSVNPVINWGSNRDYPGPIVNDPESVAVAQNKIKTFNACSELATVPFTVQRQTATEWLDKGSTVFARRLVGASGGAGIVVVRPGEQLPEAPLYTRYVKKEKEFRVHVFDNRVIAVQEKRKAKDDGKEHSLIRNHANGYVFCRQNVVEPADLRKLAIDTVSRLGLVFGAVDIIWNAKKNKSLLLEVNSAPGLVGQTLVDYTNAIRAYAV